MDFTTKDHLPWNGNAYVLELLVTSRELESVVSLLVKRRYQTMHWYTMMVQVPPFKISSPMLKKLATFQPVIEKSSLFKGVNCGRHSMGRVLIGPLLYSMANVLVGVQ